MFKNLKTKVYCLAGLAAATAANAAPAWATGNASGDCKASAFDVLTLHYVILAWSLPLAWHPCGH